MNVRSHMNTGTPRCPASEGIVTTWEALVTTVKCWDYLSRGVAPSEMCTTTRGGMASLRSPRRFRLRPRLVVETWTRSGTVIGEWPDKTARTTTGNRWKFRGLETETSFPRSSEGK